MDGAPKQQERVRSGSGSNSLPPGLAPSAPDLDPALLERALPDQYKVIERVAHGGVGAVYKAVNRYTNATVAIKVLLPGSSAETDAVHRFVEEARAAQALNDPRICKVLDFGMSDKQFPFLVMEWIDGMSLQKKVETEGPLSWQQAAQLFVEVAQALAHAHERQVLHRDLKPSNVMLTGTASGGTSVRVIDFGLAKFLDDGRSQSLTRTGEVVGTPLYMSPEQARGLQLDARSDIYALGCLMYFALTGSAPFVGESFVDTVYKHIQEDPPNLAAGGKLQSSFRKIILRSLEKNPADRYPDMQSVAADLQRLASGSALPYFQLAKQRRLTRSAVMTFLYFVCGFIIMYLAMLVFKTLGG